MKNSHFTYTCIFTNGIAAIAILFCLSGCGGRCIASNNKLQHQVDSLKLLVTAMKPGLGEYMLSLQVHHNKIWFAGMSRNWDLAIFEADEITETMNDAMAVETDRSEAKMIPMLFPALDSIKAAIDHKDTAQFRTSYTMLTNTCNSCHAANHFEFNRIRIPDLPPYSDQDYNPVVK